MKRPNKFIYLNVVQSYTGAQYGWEDVAASEDRKEARDDLKAYRENEPRMSHRLIRRRELNSEGATP